MSKMYTESSNFPLLYVCCKPCLPGTPESKLQAVTNSFQVHFNNIQQCTVRLCSWGASAITLSVYPKIIGKYHFLPMAWGKQCIVECLKQCLPCKTLFFFFWEDQGCYLLTTHIVVYRACISTHVHKYHCWYKIFLELREWDAAFWEQTNVNYRASISQTTSIHIYEVSYFFKWGSVASAKIWLASPITWLARSSVWSSLTSYVNKVACH